MKHFLLLALLGLLLAGCGEKKVTVYRDSPPDTVRVCPDCDEHGNCDKDDNHKNQEED